MTVGGAARHAGPAGPARPAEMTLPQLARLAKVVYRKTGIVLDDSKRALASGRIAKRLRALGLRDFGAYIDLVEREADGPELQALVNVITTNKTSFFREDHHFDILREQLALRAAAARQSPALRRLRIWSAGCSTGEEPYSIAMTVAEVLGRELSSWNVEIVATDIDTDVMAFAAAAVYGPERTVGLPDRARPHFDVVNAGGRSALRVAAHVRDLVSFTQLNFVEEQWPLRGTFDHVFCRNVTIYFDRPTQARLYPRLAAMLAPEGLLFAGHSENLSFCPEVFQLVGQTVYARTNGRASAPALPSAETGPALANLLAPSRAVATRSEPRMRPPPEPRTVRSIAPRPWPRTLTEKSLVAGEVHASREPLLIKTTLGSCISVCMHDPIKKLGGMNHFMLPSAKNREGSALFGIQAMETLINALLKLGADRSRLVAKIAGGCTVVQCAPGGTTVSERNLAFIDEFLETEGFPVVGRRVRGLQGLELRFRTDTGEAFVRALDEGLASRIAREDEQYAQKIVQAAPQAHAEDITWFP
jgi:chemotaxis protein methyltransferase CheR